MSNSKSKTGYIVKTAGGETTVTLTFPNNISLCDALCQAEMLLCPGEVASVDGRVLGPDDKIEDGDVVMVNREGRGNK